MEAVTLWSVRELPSWLRELKAAGYAVIGAATRGGRPETAASRQQPVALVLGNEEHGLAPAVAAACSQQVTIPGRSAVESLNVSVAGAVLLWELIGRR